MPREPKQIPRATGLHWRMRYPRETAMRKRSPDFIKIPGSEITPYREYVSRRAVLAGALSAAALQGIGGFAGGARAQSSAAALTYVRNTALSLTDPPNSYRDITTYNI